MSDTIYINTKPLNDCGYLEIHQEICLIDNQISYLLMLSDTFKQKLTKDYPNKVGDIFNHN